MGGRLSIKIDKNIDKQNYGTWQEALRLARRTLFESQQRTKALQRSIEIIKAKIKAGEPWAGESATHN
jgi:hypothetical protein